ncbi:hypothetical protein D9M70_608420 [compost metagenome]
MASWRANKNWHPSRGAHIGMSPQRAEAIFQARKPPLRDVGDATNRLNPEMLRTSCRIGEVQYFLRGRFRHFLED